MTPKPIDLDVLNAKLKRWGSDTENPKLLQVGVPFVEMEAILHELKLARAAQQAREQLIDLSEGTEYWLYGHDELNDARAAYHQFLHGESENGEDKT